MDTTWTMSAFVGRRVWGPAAALCLLTIAVGAVARPVRSKGLLAVQCSRIAGMRSLKMEPAFSFVRREEWISGEGKTAAPRRMLRDAAENGTDSESADKRLWHAAREGDLQGLQAALDDGADVNVRMSKYGDTPLLIASYHGHVDCVAALLDAGAKPNMVDRVHSGTALFWASQEGRLEVVNELLVAGANVHRPNAGTNTPLQVASEGGHAGVVDALLAFGANPRYKDALNDTALHFASATLGGSSVRIVILLIDAGAEVDARSGDGTTPLMWAAAFGNVLTVKTLLTHGADVGIVDGAGRDAAASVCRCLESRPHPQLLQCPTGGCQEEGTAEELRDVLRR